ncbi:M56 family metallopeptidase [Albibacterium sp.]|uniref:M56 family metallopeptidase n=1 Tax=Albibacterium sp. TaxID=2952885 RepID=UPI002B58F117|nr:M56 family metallopeptidase [Albibacterium sp.]HUH18457.1 M56 family metallopeptidase [Albibacterium sp.]
MEYLLWANAYLVIFYGFYWFFLRKETFFQLNRVYLISGALFSFLAPLLDLKIFKASSELLSTVLPLSITLPLAEINPEATVQSSSESTLSLLTLIYIIGCILSVIWLLYRIFIFQKNLNKPSSGDAYSFLSIVRVDPDMDGYTKIVAHEDIHSQEYHSLDVLFFELIQIINWFNPIVYLLLRSVKLNHEYIADEKATQSNDDRINYANLLVSHAFSTPVHSIMNNFFNKPFLKNRVMMLFKNKSKKSVLIRFSLLIPIMLLAFTFQSSKSIQEDPQSLAVINKSAISQLNYVEENNIPSLQEDTSRVFTSVEVPPQPIGGLNEFYKYIGENAEFSKEAFPANGSNSNVRILVSFIVEKDGSLSNINSLRDPGYGTFEEAKRLLENAPKWNPGIQNTRPVRVKFTLPIQLNPSNNQTES